MLKEYDAIQYAGCPLVFSEHIPKNEVWIQESDGSILMIDCETGRCRKAEMKIEPFQKETT